MPQAPNPISETATPDRPSCSWGTLVVAVDLGLCGIVAVEVGAFFVAVPDHFPVPVSPGVVHRMAALDAVHASATLERHAIAHQHSAVELPDVVRRLDLDVVALERQLDELAIQLHRFVQQLARQRCRARGGELGEQALGFLVETIELALDAQLDEDEFVGWPEDVEPLRRMAVLGAAGLDVKRLVDEKALDVGEYR